MSLASSWVSLLQPNILLKESIFQLTPALLDQYQLKGLVLDVDDTLVSTKNADVSPELSAWLAPIKTQMPVWLVSNNIKRPRIEKIATSLDVPYIHSANKPSRRKLHKAVIAMELPYEQIAMVGDRLFTDILAGNRLGLFTILVDPLSHGSLIHSIEFWLYDNLNRVFR